MPDPVIFERAESRPATVGLGSPSVELHFRVLNTDNDAVVRSLVEQTIPAFYAGLVFDNYTIDPTDGGLCWDVVVTYGRQRLQDFQAGSSNTISPTGEPIELGDGLKISIDTTGGTQKITQSLATSKYAPSGEEAPDFKGAIGVTGDSVEGVEIPVPVFNWTETWKLPGGLVTLGYLQDVHNLTGTVCKHKFRGFAALEVRFMGATGNLTLGKEGELTFKFSASPNAHNLQVGDITVLEKGGWDYLWVRYAPEEDDSAKVIVKRPQAAYVEQVCLEKSWAPLKIGK